jgi:hypothetical protein
VATAGSSLEEANVFQGKKSRLQDFYIQPRSSEGATRRRNGHSRHSGAKRVSGSLRSNIVIAAWSGDVGIPPVFFSLPSALLPLDHLAEGWDGSLVIRGSRAESGQAAMSAAAALSGTRFCTCCSSGGSFPPSSFEVRTSSSHGSHHRLECK